MPPPEAGRVLIVPQDALAGEIELALAYMLACNPPAYEVLTRRRRELCEAMAQMISERADKGLSGMGLKPGQGRAS